MTWNELSLCFKSKSRPPPVVCFTLLSLCFVVDPIKFGPFTKYDAGLAGVMAARYFGGEGEAARFMREEAAARRALAMASLAIATAAEDCPIEYRDESSQSTDED